RHAGGADRLARGVLDHRRARRGAGAGDLRGARDARGRAAGRRDVTGRGDGGGAPGEDRGAGARPEEAPVSGPAAEAAGPVGRGEGAEASGGPAAAPGGGPTGAAAPEDGGAEQGAEDGEWRKLSPMMLVVAPVTYLKNFIIPLILMAFGATQNPWALVSLFAALAGLAVTGVFTWATFRYQVGARRLEIRKG